ncbi:group-specific protein, partial [Bacillus pseudomycoides]
MISVQVDEKEVRNLYLAKVEEKVKEIDAELVYW